MNDDKSWEKTLGDLFRPLFDSGIKEIQESLNEIRTSKQKTSELGSFLLHHLVLEKYLEDYILTIFPEISRIEGHKVNFKKKLEIIKKLGPLNHESYTAINAINEVRNDLAHNLSVDSIKEGHKKSIYFVIQKWDEDGKLVQMLEKSNSRYLAFEICVYFLLLELLTMIALHTTKRNIEEELSKQQELMLRQLLGE